MSEQAFIDYKAALVAMEADPEIARLTERYENIFGRVLELQDEIDALRKPYGERIEVAEAAIKTLVLAAEQTITVDGVRGSYHKGRTSISWKSVAMRFEPSDELIASYAKTGEPSVKVGLVE